MFHRFYEEAMRGRRRGFGHEGFGREDRERSERGQGHRGWRGGFGPREGRMFDGGELRWVILSLIAEKPRHGYEVIKELGERVGDDYSPSPGVVYPTLTLLEDMRYAVVSPDEGGRKLYTVTSEGEKALAENKARVDAIFARFAGRVEAGDLPAFGSVIRAMMNLRAAAKLRLRVRDTTPEQIQAIVDALDDAAKKIERV